MTSLGLGPLNPLLRHYPDSGIWGYWLLPASPPQPSFDVGPGVITEMGRFGGGETKGASGDSVALEIELTW